MRAIHEYVTCYYSVCASGLVPHTAISVLAHTRDIGNGNAGNAGAVMGAVRLRVHHVERCTGLPLPVTTFSVNIEVDEEP